MHKAEPRRLTRAQVRQIDRRAIEQFGIPGVVLMENAARAAADVAMQMLGGAPTRRVLIVCGPGNNGGDGLAVARHLHNRGVDVSIILACDPSDYRGDALTNWHIVQRMGLKTLTEFPECAPDLIIDAIFGTGLTRPPTGIRAEMIRQINSSGAAVLAIDIPSGLDCDRGRPLGPCVRAATTITLVAEKAGFADPSSRRFTGRIIVGDIGCPRE